MEFPGKCMQILIRILLQTGQLGTFHYLVTELLELISKSRTAIEKLVQSRSLEAK